jgi:hypothetical protein
MSVTAQPTLTYSQDTYGMFTAVAKSAPATPIRITGGIYGHGAYMVLSQHFQKIENAAQATRFDSLELAAEYAASLDPATLIGLADSGLVTALPGEPVTLYSKSEMFGTIQKVEGKLLAHGRARYAQYPLAPFVELVPKGKRKGVRRQGSYRPFLLVLKGHGHPEPGKMFTKVIYQTPEAPVTEATHTGFSAGWVNDFNALIEPYLAANPGLVVADYREAGRD